MGSTKTVMTKHKLRWLVVTLAGVAACGVTPVKTREPDQYDGCGSDESWPTFDTQEGAAMIDDTRAPLLLLPTAGATLPSAQSPRVAWQVTPSDAGHDFGDATCEQCSLCGTSSAPIGEDHLPPITGDAYDLQFSINGTVVWRVITTLQVWTPPDGQWSSWRGKTISLRAWRMPLADNAPSPGAFTASAPLVFSVAP